MQRSCLRLARPDGTLVPVAWAGGADAASRVALPPGLGLAGRAVAAARPVQSADVLEDPALDYGADLREQVMASPWRAALAVPLRAKGQIIGALVLIDHRGRVFSEAELGLAQAFGDQAALALENARLHGETERRRRQAEALARVASRLTGSLDVSTVAERIISSVPALLGMRTAGLRLLEEDGSLRTIAYGGEGTPPFAVGHVLPPGAGIAGAAVAGGGPTWTSDLLADRRYTIPGDLAALLQSSDYRAFVSVPLRVKGA
ncbi:MAG: GAF domain-containing protein, partial [Candidatus Rokubacteria bacterium]|nr:GAF domain-containing protein [Candidatus Rokubacteria bacterium]